MSEAFINFQGVYLICVKETGIIKEGMRAYCMHDVSHNGYIRILLEYPVFGIHEFKIASSLKNNFKITG